MKKHLILIIIILLQAGCASEIKKKHTDSFVLNKADREYADRSFLEAEESYKKILDTFPDSQYGRNAKMGQADALFRQGKYMEASWSYREYYDLFPSKKDAAKARFYKGMSNYLERKSYDRDQTDTLKALEQFEKITSDPDFNKSVFYDESKKNIQECKDLLARNIFHIGHYYFRTVAYGAAINRMKSLLNTYPGEPYEDEAIYILAESYFREDNYVQADIYFKNMLEKYPQSNFSLKAKQRLSEIKTAGDRTSPIVTIDNNL